MQIRLILLLLFALLLPSIHSYSTTITVSSTASASITNFYQDLAYCSCDLTPSLCDNYCCCDASCSTTLQNTWTAASSCLSTSSSVQSFCNSSSVSGFGSFSDLSCVYFSNRGTIGNYYSYPQTSSLTFTTSTKFTSVSTAGTVASQFTSSATAISNSAYSTTNPYLRDTATTFFHVPRPGPAGACISGVLNVTTAANTYYCHVTPTANNCASLNSLYSGTICLTGTCATTSAAQTITAASVSGTNCNNVLTGLTVTYTVGSTQSAYTLSAATITPTYSNVAIGTSTVVTVTHTPTAPASFAGNPGYQVGKTVTITPALSAMGNPTTGVCYTTTGATGSTTLIFGQDAVYRCQSASPCATSYYIDALLTTTFTITQYADQSITTITVSGTGAATNCNYESYTLEVIYSYGGWELDPQYYVVGAKLIPSFSPDSPTAPTTKYMKVKWVYVDPKTVNSPPNNLFYQYFSYLWTPLKQQFGLN